LETSQNVLQESEINVPALLEVVMAEAQSLSAQRHRLLLQADPALHLKGSREELHSAFGNLVSNAIRYTPEGGHITVRCGRDDGAAFLEVEDSGPGIALAERERVFERFHRVPGAAADGSGLGLAIVREIAQSHDAHIRLTDARGGGTIVRVIFRSAADEPAADA
jgi:signal transduction histidine kinase